MLASMAGTDEKPSTAVDAAIEYLRPRLAVTPVVAIVLGSGLGRIADQCSGSRAIPYADIPGFPPCSVDGHKGQLSVGDWGGVPVAILEGRAHRYEGHSLEVVTRPIRALAVLGVRMLITTCAAGSVGKPVPGDLLLIEDHLNLMGDNPLLGMGDSLSGASRFVEMADAYDPWLRRTAQEAAAETGIALSQGVLACVPGPSYETAAEAEMLGRLGARAVTMSIVPEVIVARALKLRVMGLAVLTNQAGARLDSRVGHQAVVTRAEGMAQTIGLLLTGVLQRLKTASFSDGGGGAASA